MRLILLAVLLFFTPSVIWGKNIVEGVNENKCKYYLSTVAIFQDEAAYLKEWLEYHLLVGVEHFYLYNNNSQDHYLDVLKPYLSAGIVDLIDWPSPDVQDWTPYQEQAYNHCIQHCKGKTNWLAVIDLDEFIVPVARRNLPDLLEKYDRNTAIGGIMVFWQFYGTSWVHTIPKDKLLIETLTLKAHNHHPSNFQVKTICKPHKVAHYYVHGALYKPGYCDITTNGGGGPHQPIQLDQIRINHYWTRDESYFLNYKIPRRERLAGRIYSPIEIQEFLDSLNAVEDKVIERYVPKLRKKMFKN